MNHSDSERHIRIECKGLATKRLIIESRTLPTKIRMGLLLENNHHIAVSTSDWLLPTEPVVRDVGSGQTSVCRLDLNEEQLD